MTMQRVNEMVDLEVQVIKNVDKDEITITFKKKEG